MRKLEIHNKRDFYGSLLALVGIFVVAWWMLQPRVPPLTIYCAGDTVPVRQVLDRFEKETGIRLRVVWAEGGHRSHELVERILAEGEQPECNVF